MVFVRSDDRHTDGCTYYYENSEREVLIGGLSVDKPYTGVTCYRLGRRMLGIFAVELKTNNTKHHETELVVALYPEQKGVLY